jgi:hypothetical protein
MPAAEQAMARSGTSRVFISYKRNVAPDRTLAGEMVAGLSQAGHTVFIDERLAVGQAWAREIESQVRESDFLVVFLTAESSHSEMVRGEIEIARRQAASGCGPRILPVRLAFDGPLPYPLNAYLDGIQYAIWDGPSDSARLLSQLLAAIAGNPQRCAPHATTDRHRRALEDLPLYAAPLPVPGGTLDVDDPWYLPRPTDDAALAVIRQAGQTLTIKGPRQMGKSSLVMRTIRAALDLGKKVALLDFQLLDDQTKANPDLFFRRFASSIAEQLEVPDDVEELWDSGFSNPQNCTRCVERLILGRLSGPCVLAIDETDCVFQTSFSADFFSMLRSWHGLRAHPARRSWKRLDIILSTSTEPQFFIVQPHESPFNVGITLPLEDFGPDEVEQLNALHPSPLGVRDVERLYTLVQGHPYLTRKALYLVASRTPSSGVHELFVSATADAGPFGDHLRYYLLRLQGKPDLIAAFWQVIENRGCDNELLAYRLQAAGLVRRDGNRIVPRCELYAKYFRERLHAAR